MPKVTNELVGLFIHSIRRKKRRENIPDPQKDKNLYERYTEDYSKIPVLPENELRDLIKAAQNNNIEARNKIIKSNLRLVIYFAKRFQHIKGELDFLDLIQEGNMGLIKAIELFDLNRNFKFSTFAQHRIRYAIQRAIGDKSRTVRIPVHVQGNMNKVGKTIFDLKKQLGRHPTLEEIAEKAEINPEQVEKILLNCLYASISIDEDIRSDDSIRSRTLKLRDFLADDQKTPEEEAMDKERYGILAKALETLGPQEREIVELRFGLKDGNQLKLKEIGERFGLCRERIRQIEAKTLRHLKNIMTEIDNT